MSTDEIPSAESLVATGTAVAPPIDAATCHLGDSVYRTLSLAAVAAAVLVAAACSGPRVDVLSSTAAPSTTPATSTPPATPPTTPASVTRQFRGTIDRIDATTQILVVDGASVSVPSSATIRDSAGATLAFASLQVGDVVAVTATVNGGTLTATAIVREAQAPSTVTVDGRVAAVSGTCPTLTFAVSDVTVTTSASTTVSGGSCAQIVNGVDVHATGTRQADRSIAATQVTIRP